MRAYKSSTRLISYHLLWSINEGATYFFKVPAHCLAKILPTPVLPVNETFLIVLLAQMTCPTLGESCEVMTLSTPGGKPACWASCGIRITMLGDHVVEKKYAPD
jgi:hypothetical protein